jgi:hypothetical protein
MRVLLRGGPAARVLLSAVALQNKVLYIGELQVYGMASYLAEGGSLPMSTTRPLRQDLAEAARFWEPGRIAYNLVLAAVVIAWILLTWPHFRSAFTLWSLVRLAILALLANVCYSAAYLVDIALQWSPLAAAWNQRRWALWLAGTLLAFVFTNYWIADEIYPFVR